MNIHVVTEFLQSAAATIAVGRLIWLGLVKNFPALFAYLLFTALSNLIYGFLPQNSALYFWAYVIDVPLECMLSILALRELLSLVFNDYPGIVTIGRWALYAGTTLAILISLVLAGAFWREDARRHSGILYVEVSYRSIVFSLAILIGTILFALSRYPLRFSRNTWVSSLCFSFLFLTEAARQLIDSLAPHLYNHYVDGAESLIIASILLLWTALLRRHKEIEPPRRNPATADEMHLMEQLDSLNEVFGGAGRG